MESGNTKNGLKANRPQVSPIQIVGHDNQANANRDHQTSKMRRSNSFDNRICNLEAKKVVQLFKDVDEKSISLIQNKDDASHMGGFLFEGDNINDVYSLQRKLEETNRSDGCPISADTILVNDGL